MVNHFLKLGGVTSVEEFYRKFPTEAHFDNHVHKMKYGGMYAYDKGGPIMPGTLSRSVRDMMEADSRVVPPSTPQLDENDRIYNMVNQIAAGANRQMPPPEYNNYTIPDAVNTTVTVSKPSVPKVSPYSGVSIVDFLASNNKATDKASRKKLAESLGMTGYTGKASENNRLLKLLQAKPELLDDYETVVSRPRTGATKSSGTYSAPTFPTNSSKKTSSSNSSKTTTPIKQTERYSESTFPKTEEVVEQPVVDQGYQPTPEELEEALYEQANIQMTENPYIIDPVVGKQKKLDQLPDTPKGFSYDRRGDTPITFGSGSFLEQIKTNQPRPFYEIIQPRYLGGRPGKKGVYDKAWKSYQDDMSKGRKPSIPKSVADYYYTDEWEAALQDFKNQLSGKKMGGQPCYNCGGMYDQGGMYPDGRALVNTYAHGGYYGNVPQHGNPGTYADGTSGTSSGGQYFAFGGDLLRGFSQGMRDGSLQGLAGAVAGMSGANTGTYGGITSPIKSMNDKSGNLKTDLTTYLSGADGNLDAKAIQDIVNKYAAGGAFIPVQTMPGQLPKYGYGKAMYGMGMQQGGMYAEGGMTPEEEQAMMMVEQQGQQQAPPQEQQQGPDPQQVMQQVAQMLQQGAQPEQVMQQLVQMGIPQEQAQQIIQQVMQQMQGGQEQQPPMGMYGGGYAYGGVFGRGGEECPDPNAIKTAEGACVCRDGYVADQMTGECYPIGEGQESIPENNPKGNTKSQGKSAGNTIAQLETPGAGFKSGFNLKGKNYNFDYNFGLGADMKSNVAHNLNFNIPKAFRLGTNSGSLGLVGKYMPGKNWSGQLSAGVPLSSLKGRNDAIRFTGGLGQTFNNTENTNTMRIGSGKTPYNYNAGVEYSGKMLGEKGPNVKVTASYNKNNSFAVGGEYDVNENDIQELLNKGYKIQYI